MCVCVCEEREGGGRGGGECYSRTWLSICSKYSSK